MNTLKKTMIITGFAATVFANETLESKENNTTNQEEQNTLYEQKSGMYFGVDVVNSSSDLTADLSSNIALTQNSIDGTEDSKAVRFKLGTVSEEGFRVIGHLTIENFDNGIYSSNDGAAINLGVEATKSFDVDKHFKPFIGLGVGYGTIQLGDIPGVVYEKNSAVQVNVTAKAGAYIPLNETLEVELGAEVMGRKWQPIRIEDGSNYIQIDTREKATRYYVGVNVHF